MNEAISTVNIEGFEKYKSGKVREVFGVDDRILIVATDRISAFDWVLPTLIPFKGRILTGLSVFWFEKTRHITENHLITSDVDAYPPVLKKHGDMLQHRSMLVKKAKVFPVECVVRGYISGSAWKDYQATGLVAGMKYADLKQCEKFAEPIFTPATKAESGHDENITFEQAANLIGKEQAAHLREKSIALYNFAHDYALKRGIIIADTKFEFGLADGRVMLVDEVFTPDSSRFWEAGSYKPGQDQPSYDKQFVRNYLISVKWDRNSPPPELPPEIVEKTVSRYKEAFTRLTDKKL